MFSEHLAIRAEGLNKVFAIYDRPIDRLKQRLMGGRRQYGRLFPALTDVSFSLPRGQVLGLVGNNGAGKSTLLQMVCSTLSPTSGRLEVNGRVAALLELGAGFNPEFSGRENVFLNAAVIGLSSEEIEDRYNEIVSFSGIGDFIEQPVKTYSSGMYVRLAFAIATAVDPDILVIDEALSVGDGAFARKSFDRIMALKERGATILFCSHSMYHIEAICDTALWLDRGRMQLLDVPGRVVKAYAEHQNSDALAQVSMSAGGLKEVPQPLSSGQARLLGVIATVDGVSGKKLELRAGLSDLVIEVDFQTAPDLPTPSVAFGLDTLGGISVCSGSTQFDGVNPDIAADGKGHVTLRFPQLPLMRGKYRLTIFLACERVIHVYDHALYCVELEVVHQGIEQGLVFLPHAWNEGQVVCVP